MSRLFLALTLLTLTSCASLRDRPITTQMTQAERHHAMWVNRLDHYR